MSCERWQIDISAWLDGALLPAEEKRLRAHLSTCAGCSRFLAVQRRLGHALSSAEQLEPPPGLWLRLEGELRRRRRETRVPQERSWWRWIQMPQWAYAASALLLVLSGLVAVRIQEPGDQASERWLAELDSFRIQASGNPFMAPVENDNPFFEFARNQRGNPFKGGGETQ